MGWKWRDGDRGYGVTLPERLRLRGRVIVGVGRRDGLLGGRGGPAALGQAVGISVGLPLPAWVRIWVHTLFTELGTCCIFGVIVFL